MQVFTIEYANCDDPAETLLDIYTTRRQAVVDALVAANDVMDECYDEVDGLYQLELIDDEHELNSEMTNCVGLIRIIHTETLVDQEWWRVRKFEVTEESSFTGEVPTNVVAILGG